MDSNVLIDYIGQNIPLNEKLFVEQVINMEFIIPSVVKIEVLGFNENFPDKILMMREFVGLATLLPLDNSVIEETIELRRNYKKLKLGDAIIAATALVYNLVLITRNSGDFKNIPGLSIIDAHEI